MGRGKLNMELISKERSRMTTYFKRKKGLLKKAREFQILCDVDVCVIIFGPKLNNRPVDVETSPNDRTEVGRIINRFRAKGTERKKTQDLSDFFVGRKKKVDDEIAKLREAYLKAKFPVWDNRLNLFSPDQLKVLASLFDARLEVARSKIMNLKGHRYWTDEVCKSGTMGGFVSNKVSLMASTFANAFLQKNIELEPSFNHQSSSFMRPSAIQLPAYYPPEQSLHQMPPFHVNPVLNPTLLMMNGEDFSQFSGLYSSKIPCPPINPPLYYNYDAANEMTGNWIVSNPRGHPISYHGPSRQPVMSNGQGPVMLNRSSQMCAPEFSDFYDINGGELNRR